MTDLLLFFFFKSYAHPRDLPSPPTRPSPDLAPADFKTIGARVRAVGAHVAIYVDTLAPPPGLDSAEIDTLRQVVETLDRKSTRLKSSHRHTSFSALCFKKKRMPPEAAF